MCLAKGQLSSADQSYQHIALKFCPLVEGQSHYNALKLTLGSYAEYMYTAELWTFKIILDSFMFKKANTWQVSS